MYFNYFICFLEIKELYKKREIKNASLKYPEIFLCIIFKNIKYYINEISQGITTFLLHRIYNYLLWGASTNPARP